MLSNNESIFYEHRLLDFEFVKGFDFPSVQKNRKAKILYHILTNTHWNISTQKKKWRRRQNKEVLARQMETGKNDDYVTYMDNNFKH